jgi:hypothetical protein
VCESGTARSCMCLAKDTFNNKILQALISTMVVIQDKREGMKIELCVLVMEDIQKVFVEDVLSGCWNSTQSLGERKRTLSSSAPRRESSQISLIRKSNWATGMEFL